MEGRDLDERLLGYAVRIVKVVEALPGTLAGRRIADQLLRIRSILSKAVATAKQNQESKRHP